MTDTTISFSQESRIFQPFRALGLCSSHQPHVIKYHPVNKKFYILIPIGNVLHIYNTKLGLTHVSNGMEFEISCMTANDQYSFIACKNIIKALKFHCEIAFTYSGHTHNIQQLMCIAGYLLSIDTSSCVKIWEIESQDMFTELNFENESFELTAVLHPSTYLNKVLFASKQGKMQLWNIRRNTMVYEFSGWNQCITTLVQAPALDVIGVGLVTGDIILHNIKMDKTIKKFHQDFGPVTGLTFKTDGNAILVSSGTNGNLSVWDLTDKRLVGVMKAHSGSVAGVSFLPSQPLLVTNGSDNSVVIWAFDQSDDLGRQLRIRNGHSAPPTKLLFHDDDGLNIISSAMDCQLRSFSTDYEGKNKNLGTASLLSKSAKKRKENKGHGKLPPIIDFCSETSREGFWDNIVAVHHRHSSVTTWNYKRGNMGDHKLKHQRFTPYTTVSWGNAYVTAITMTACGNFCIIGTSSGHIDIFNIQSGIHRGTFIDEMFKKSEQAHTREVHGLAVDASNQILASASTDKLLKFWTFKPPSIMKKIYLESIPAKINLHRGSSMMAMSTDDFDILVYDMETQKLVRKFVGHSCSVTDMTWRNDGRWLVTSGMDCTIRTWDLPSGCMVDCFMVDSAVTSLTFSPASDLLATSHVDEVGIYLWSNKCLFQYISLNPLSQDYDPEEAVALPGEKVLSEEIERDDIKEVPEEMIANEYTSMKQLDTNLITLSGLPSSRWANLLVLDVIKEKNKPKQPPKVPEQAPFFLPTISGLVPKFDDTITLRKQKENNSKITLLEAIENLSPFGELVVDCLNKNSYGVLLNEMKSMGPSAIDREICCLCPEMGGSIELMEAFLKFILHTIKSKVDFELVQSYLGLVMKIHAETLASSSSLVKILDDIEQENDSSWPEVHNLFDQNLCLINFIKSVTI